MLGLRISKSLARQFVRNNSRPSVLLSVAQRHYAAKAAGPEPKLHPLSGPIGDELDPRFGDLPPWNIPVINRQNLTETPAVPYDDPQNRRYWNEPVCVLSPMLRPEMLNLDLLGI